MNFAFKKLEQEKIDSENIKIAKQIYFMESHLKVGKLED